MKFGAPLLTTELSGALGGIVGSKSRGGVRYFRVRARPSNPRTFAQSRMREILASLAAAWTTTLTTLQRAAWSGIAGSSSSGINAFCKGNTQQVLAEEDFTATAPSSLALTVTPIATCTIDASAHTVSFSANVGILDEIDANLYLAGPQHESRASRQLAYLFSNHIGGDDNIATIPTTHPAYNLTAGQVVYAKLIRFGRNTGDSAGKVAIAQEFRCIVVA